MRTGRGAGAGADDGIGAGTGTEAGDADGEGEGEVVSGNEGRPGRLILADCFCSDCDGERTDDTEPSKALGSNMGTPPLNLTDFLNDEQVALPDDDENEFEPPVERDDVATLSAACDEICAKETRGNGVSLASKSSSAVFCFAGS